MKKGFLYSGLLMIILFHAGIVPAQAQNGKNKFVSDICIYGGTASGVIAAVQAATMGKSVVLIEPGKHVGGMTSGGLGNTDIGKQETIGGLTRKFYQQVHQWYQDAAHWKYQAQPDFLQTAKPARITPDALFVFEPHVAETIMNQMLTQANVKTVFNEQLD